MVESGPPTVMGQWENLAENSSHASCAGMLSTHTSPCMQERRAHRPTIENSGLTGKGCVSSLLHTRIQIHDFKTAYSVNVSWIESAWVQVYVQVLYLSSFQRLLGPDGISPAHSSLSPDTHDWGSDSFSVTTQLSQQRRTSACCILLNGRGVDGWLLKEAGNKSSEFDCQARSGSWGCWCYWKRMG